MLHRRRFLTTTSSGLALGAVALLLGRGALAQRDAIGCRAFLLLRRIGIDVALGTAHRLLLLSYCGLDRRNGRWNLRHRHDALGGGLLAHDLKQAQALLVEEDQVAGGAGFEFVEHGVDLE